MSEVRSTSEAGGTKRTLRSDKKVRSKKSRSSGDEELSSSIRRPLAFRRRNGILRVYEGELSVVEDEELLLIDSMASSDDVRKFSEFMMENYP